MIELAAAEELVLREMVMAEALADCLEAAGRGGADLQACAEKYPPESRGELLALSLLAITVPSLGDIADPSAEWLRRTKDSLLAMINSKGETLSLETG